MKFNKKQKSIIAYFISLNAEDEWIKPSVRKQMNNILAELQQENIWGNEFELRNEID